MPNNIKFKHLRGRHDQLDHAWNRGMGRGGGGAALAPNQMGPLPTTDFYRQRRIELMEQQRQGKITNAEMRRQMRQLRGITTDTLASNQNMSNEMVLANRANAPTSFAGSNLRQQIKNYRNQQRPARRMNVKPFLSQMKRVRSPDGNPNVLSFTAQGKNGKQQLNYYPVPPRHGSYFTGTQWKSQWFVGSNTFMPLIVDDFATAMGMDIAPVAQMTSNGTIVTSNMSNLNTTIDPQQYVSGLISEMRKNPSTQLYRQIESILEPIVAMELMFGLGVDDSAYALMPGNAVGSTLQYSIARIKNDTPGSSQTETSMYRRFQTLRNEFEQFRPRSETGYFSNNMIQVLRDASQTVQWNSAIPEMMRTQMQDRINTLARLSSVTDLVPEETNFTIALPADRGQSEEAVPYVNGDDNAKHALNMLNEVFSNETMAELSNPAASAIIQSITGKSASEFYDSITEIIQRPIKIGQDLLNSNLSPEEISKLKQQGQEILQRSQKEIAKIQQQIQEISDVVGNLTNWQRNFVTYGFAKEGEVLFSESSGVSRSGPINPGAGSPQDIANRYRAYRSALGKIKTLSTQYDAITEEINKLDRSLFQMATPRSTQEKRNKLVGQANALRTTLEDMQAELDKVSGQYIYFAINNILSNPANLKKFINKIKDIPKNNIHLNNPVYIVKMLHELFG